MSRPEPRIDVPYELRGGAWANHGDVFGDVEEATLDFIRLDPRDPRGGVVVGESYAVSLGGDEVEVGTGAIRVKKYEPHDWSYKTKVRKPTAEEEAILERWRKEVEERVQARLRAYYGR